MNITIFLFIIITIFIIIQLFNLSYFVFKYIYNYHSHNYNIDLCKNNFIEYEQFRYYFYNNLKKFYLTNNISTTLNYYLVFIIVSIFSILFSLVISFYIFNILNDINKNFYDFTILNLFINFIFYLIILHVLSYIPYLLAINFDNNILISKYIVNKVNNNLHFFVFGLYIIGIIILLNYNTNFSLPFFIILLIIFEFFKFLTSYNIRILKLKNNNNDNDNDDYNNYDITNYTNDIFLDYLNDIFGFETGFKIKDNIEDNDNDISQDTFASMCTTTQTSTSTTPAPFRKSSSYYISSLYKNIENKKINFNIFIILIFIIIFIVIFIINNIKNINMNNFQLFIECFTYSFNCKYLLFKNNDYDILLNYFILPIIILFILLIIIESTYKYNTLINNYIIHQPSKLYLYDTKELVCNYNIFYNKIKNGNYVNKYFDYRFINSVYLTFYNNIFSNFLSKNNINLLIGLKWKISTNNIKDKREISINVPDYRTFYTYLEKIVNYKNSEIELTLEEYKKYKIDKLSSQYNLNNSYISIETSSGNIINIIPVQNYSDKYYYMNLIPEFKYNKNIDISSDKYDIKYYINSKCDKKNIFYSSNGNSKDYINYDLIIYILNDIFFNYFENEDFKNYIKVLIYKSYTNIKNKLNYLGNYKLSSNDEKNNNLYFLNKIDNFYYEKCSTTTDFDISNFDISNFKDNLEDIKLSNVEMKKYVDIILNFNIKKSSYEEIIDAIYKISGTQDEKNTFRNNLLDIFKIKQGFEFKFNNNIAINEKLNTKIDDILKLYVDIRTNIKEAFINFIESYDIEYNINDIYKTLIKEDKSNVNTFVAIIIDNLIELFDRIEEELKDEIENVDNTNTNLINTHIKYNYDYIKENSPDVLSKDSTNLVEDCEELKSLEELVKLDKEDKDKINKYINLKKNSTQYTFFVLLIIYILSYLILNKIKL